MIRRSDFKTQREWSEFCFNRSTTISRCVVIAAILAVLSAVGGLSAQAAGAQGIAVWFLIAMGASIIGGMISLFFYRLPGPV